MEYYFSSSEKLKERKEKKERKSVIEKTFNGISSISDKKQICKAFAKLSTFEGRKALLDKIYDRSQEIAENELRYKIECFTPYIVSFKDKLQKKVEIKKMLLDNLGSFDYYRGSYFENMSSPKKKRKRNLIGSNSSRASSDHENPARPSISPAILRNFQSVLRNPLGNSTHKKSMSTATNFTYRKNSIIEEKEKIQTYRKEKKKHSAFSPKHIHNFEKYLLDAFNKKVIPSRILEGNTPSSKFSLSESRIKEKLKKSGNYLRKSGINHDFLRSDKAKKSNVVVNPAFKRKPVIFSISTKKKRNSMPPVSELKPSNYAEGDDESLASFTEIRLDNLYKNKIETDKYLLMLEGIRDTWGIYKTNQINQLISKRKDDNIKTEKFQFLNFREIYLITNKKLNSAR